MKQLFTFERMMLISGYIIFFLATAGMIYHEAIAVMIFVLFIPGPVLGFIIAWFKKTSLARKALFFTITCLVCLAMLYMVTGNVGLKFIPLKILLAGSLSAVLLQFFFDLIFGFNLSHSKLTIRPALLGLSASLLSMVAVFYLNEIPGTNWLAVLLWVCLFSIFPLWFFLFGRHLSRTGRI